MGERRHVVAFTIDKPTSTCRTIWSVTYPTAHSPIPNDTEQENDGD